MVRALRKRKQDGKKMFGDGGGGAWENDGGRLSSREVTFALNAEKEGSLRELVGERGARRSAFSPRARVLCWSNEKQPGRFVLKQEAGLGSGTPGADF